MELEHLASSPDAFAVHRTVAVVDMVGYSSLARVLEENMGTLAVAELNGQIQALIRAALSELPVQAEHCTIAQTGDGVILAFTRAEDAHSFACALYHCAESHNRTRTEDSATRWFRIGIASGLLTRQNLRQEDCGWAGITIANAVRLESAAQPGEIVMDLASYEALPADIRTLYGGEEIVRGKRTESFHVRKCGVTRAAASAAAHTAAAHDEGSSRQALALPMHAQETLFASRVLSRRGFLAAGGCVTAAAALGLWTWRDDLERVLHPLPAKRFVALHAWPKPEAEVAAIVHRVVASIDDRLTRAEPQDKQFMVMYPGDPLFQASGLPPPGESLVEVADALGANLVLAASSKQVRGRIRLTLRLLAPETEKVLRQASFSTALSEISSLGQRAATAAAELLDLPASDHAMADDEEIAAMDADAYKLLAEGKRLVDEPNDAGLDAGVEKLQQLTNEHPRYAIGYAELARGYLRQYHAVQHPATLGLARENAKRSLVLNPESGRGMLGQAQVDVYSGDTEAALDQIRHGLKLNPLNAELLIFKGLVYRNLGKLAEEESVYRQITANRPNDWIAYNELGGVLERSGRLPEAIQAFSKATELAPSTAMPLTNLGGAYLQMGRNAQAQGAFERSLKLAPNAIAYIGLGDLAFESKDYPRAISDYQKAHALTPADDSTLRDLGDCYFMLGQTGKVKEAFAQAAELLAAKLQINPKNGPGWMTLAFYHAKTGDFPQAQQDIQTAEERGAHDIESEFLKAQTYAVMGRQKDALAIVLDCLHRGLTQTEVELAVDLQAIRGDPQYQTLVSEISRTASAA